MSNKKIIFVHGKNTKPPPAVHRELLLRSLRAGFAASTLNQEMGNFKETDFILCSWSDLLYPDYADTHALTRAVERLETLPNDMHQNKSMGDQMTYSVRRFLYLLIDRFPILMRLIPSPHVKFMLGGTAQYFDNEENVAVRIRARLTQVMKSVLVDKANELLIIGHSLGAVIVYDLLTSQSEWLAPQSLRLITMGCPLGLRFTQSRIHGAMKIFPTAISRWDNISAHGDLVSLDATLRDDFQKMEQLDLLESIHDTHGIMNNYLDASGDNPHKSHGYLANPIAAQIIARWYLNLDQ